MFSSKVKSTNLQYNINFEIMIKIIIREVYYASNSLYQLGFLTSNFYHDGASIHTVSKHA